MKHPGKNWNLRMMIDNSSMLRICLLIFVYMLVNMFVKLELVAEQESSFLTSKRWKIDNLPEEYLEHSNRELDAEATKEEHCGKYPELWDLQFSNNHWQVYERKRDVFYLYGAYLDTRRNKEYFHHTSIRILTMTRSQHRKNSFCQIWFEKMNDPVVTEVSSDILIADGKHIIEHESEEYISPHLMTCHLPEDYLKKIPKSVSLVNSNCSQATNNLKVNYNLPTESEPKQLFGVCMKAVTITNDESDEIIQWIEMLRVLGASKIFFYILWVHPNILKVLQYYEEQGIVELTHLTLAGSQPNHPSLQNQYYYHQGDQSYFQRLHNEKIGYNDCFYRNMYRWKLCSSLHLELKKYLSMNGRFYYIPVFDTDEVIVPVKYNSWVDMMGNITKKYPAENIGSWEISRYNFVLDSNDQSLFQSVKKYNMRGTFKISNIMFYKRIFSCTLNFVHLLHLFYRPQQEHIKSCTY